MANPVSQQALTTAAGSALAGGGLTFFQQDRPVRGAGEQVRRNQINFALADAGTYFGALFASQFVQDPMAAFLEGVGYGGAAKLGDLLVRMTSQLPEGATSRTAANAQPVRVRHGSSSQASGVGSGASVSL